MSTFDGIVPEFPSIQIDYFRKSPDRPPPLVCFLSHVHSDHLQGLESFRAPFIYCSAATRELLLRIEKYPHRMNFSKGILESRRLHYKHLAKLLRPIPLGTPTVIDLTPRLSIRVVLIDANHCTGAVMFLIEGDGKAILYTGDIRAEPWWVNSIIRHPVLIPYTLGTKQLDKMYLDTTFARPSHICRVFPSKAEGLAELLRKVEAYPDDTTFYFRAWTMGYEEVWVALSAALKSKVHVDRYQMDLYRSLSSSRVEGGISEVPSLCGFDLGNRFVPGCLSEDERAQIHSCEPGVQCSSVARSRDVVYIMPVVNRTKDGVEVPELGAGGGGGDLYQIHELELPDKSALEQLEKLCLERIHDTQALSHTRQALIEAFESKRKVLPLDRFGMKDGDEISLERLVKMLGRGRVEEAQLPGLWTENTPTGDALPRVIRFPYSRHSSYTELCDLVAAFRPKDIHPCTVDPGTWTEEVSMQNLFGHLCSATVFAHDELMRHLTTTDKELMHRRKRLREEAEALSVTPQSTQQSSSMLPPEPKSQSPSTEEDLNLPSSFATINETTYNPTSFAPTNPKPTTTTNTPPAPAPAPFPIAPPTPRTAQTHRHALHQAWTFLHTMPDSQREAYNLSSLPSSWPTAVAPDHYFPADEPEMMQEDPSPEGGEKTVPPSRDSSPERMRPSLAPPPPPAAETESQSQHDNHGSERIPSPRPDLPAPSYPDPHPTLNSFDEVSDEDTQPLIDDLASIITTTEHSSSDGGSTITTTTTPSSRSLKRQRQRHRQQHQSPTPTPPAPATPHRKRTRTRTRTLTRRQDAYLAAQADSYEAWALAAPLMSTGNNHTEEEVEL
ncbi:putative DNA repair protein [Aspergillus saccharolyticus JOP 1030-1]|uniref:Protein artemis n=1 Tax=Aspergillus saccharolyticus JOP 1030-1 TaxID=1450539 RepID=A0A318ZEU3_9EURO|nr:hypothetical protein BP01DRAFT_392145 [Aspergillus saccharolyticus JOP 1030-1]PYH44804.1 hypothetical protein BP01DRAFT_392145 [Aspergillus saccharolyticus JOP 1030-1]